MLGAATLLFPICALVIPGTAAPAGAAGTYSIAGWGTLTPISGPAVSGLEGIGQNMSVSGEGAGFSYHSGSNQLEVTHAVVFKGGTLTDLGTLQPGDSSTAISVNDSGTAVGSDSVITGGTSAPATPVEWSNGTIKSLAGGKEGEATAINDPGQVVGALTTNGSPTEAVQFNSDGSVTDLGNIPDTDDRPAVAALGINDAGHIVGATTNSLGDLVAVTFSGGTATKLPPLSGLPASVAEGISQRNGYIVGEAENHGGSVIEAAQFGPGATAVDLGHLSGDVGSFAQAVNSAGVAVGWSEDAQGNSRAVMFSGGQVIALNTLIPGRSGWTLQEANGINDTGVIVGTWTLNGVQQGFTMSPLPVVPPPLGPLATLLSPIPILGPVLVQVVQELDHLLNLNL
jgi:probable HAF family extracellular repeat protein